MSLVHMCWTCAGRVGINMSLLPSAGRRRPCPFCSEQEIGSDHDTHFPTCIAWPGHCWPIAFGNALRKLAGLPHETGLW